MGFFSIPMKQSQIGGYPWVELSTSVKNWQRYWFYLRNHGDGQLPAFSPDRAIQTVEPRTVRGATSPMSSAASMCILTASRASIATGSRGSESSTRTTDAASLPSWPDPSVCTRWSRGILATKHRGAVSPSPFSPRRRSGVGLTRFLGGPILCLPRSRASRTCARAHWRWLLYSLLLRLYWLLSSPVPFHTCGFDLVLVSQLDLAPIGFSMSCSLVPEEVNANVER